MIKQYRLERYNGVEVLVCEMYERHTWTSEEVDAFAFFSKDHDNKMSRQEFATLLDEWCEEDHPDVTFYGLDRPIPVIETVPHIVLRGAVSGSRICSLAVDFVQSVTSLEVKDAVSSFLDFVRSPHWRNTIAHQLFEYGSLFGPDNDSQSR